MSNKYDFKSVISLEKDLNYILSTCKLGYINVCAYKIINETVKPFIIYLFLNNKKDKKCLSLPKISIENTSYNEETLIDFLKNGILAEVNRFEKVPSLNKNDIMFNGIDIYQDEGYIFFDISSLNLNYHIENTYRFILLNEILNLQTNIYKIDDKDVTFFVENLHYGLLYDVYGKACETPISLYLGLKENELFYNFNLGIQKSKNIFGKGYYLTNYKNASLGNKYVIRVALFLGRTCIKENFPNDNYEEPNVFNKNELLLDRITDCKEIWKNNFDSVYVGKIELDDGNEFEPGPLYAFKRWDQHITLSYEYVNT